MAIIFLAAYFHSLLNQETAVEPAAGYFWDATRRFASYCLALSIFYAGMGRQVLDLPVLIAFQLTNAPFALWSAETWFFLALFCLLISSYWLIVEIEWRSGLLAIGAILALVLSLARPRRPRRPAPGHLQPAPYLTPSNAERGSFALRRSALLTSAAAILLLLAGWQVLRLLDFPSTLSQALGDSPVVGLLPSQRFTPTPTPDLPAQAMGVLAGEQAAQPAANTLVDNAADNTAEADTAAQPIPPTPVPTLPPASTPLPTPTWTPTPGPDNSPFALIQNAAGVNARTEPSLDGTVTTILRPGTVAPIMEQTADGQWLRVRLESGDAWVAAWVVEISQPFTQPAAAPQAVAVEPTATATAAPPVAPATAAPVADANQQTVSASSVAPNRAQNSYSVYLDSPPNGFASNDEFKFRWNASFVPAANQTFEVVIWGAGQDAMTDGISLGRALPPTSDQPAQFTASLAQRNLAAGTYRWGVVLIQREPYRRLALLSSDGQIIFAP
ncbi:MAG: SH3 domain-containing protein [Caldilineaceae bacterium]